MGEGRGGLSSSCASSGDDGDIRKAEGHHPSTRSTRSAARRKAPHHARRLGPRACSRHSWEIIEGFWSRRFRPPVRRHPAQQFLEVDTSSLFIAAGAFAGIETCRQRPAWSALHAASARTEERLEWVISTEPSSAEEDLHKKFK